MTGYKLSVKALEDVAEIIGYLHLNGSPHAADKIELRFMKGFGDLGRLPGSGHRRPQITTRNLLFYNVLPT